MPNLRLKQIQDSDDRHYENRFNGYITVAMAYICTKFCTRLSKYTSHKIQYGGGRYFEIQFKIHFNSDNSVIIAHICTTSQKQIYLQISLLRKFKIFYMESVQHYIRFFCKFALEIYFSRKTNSRQLAAIY